jgi:hypothetical protein
MKKLHATLFSCFIFTSTTYTMEQQIQPHENDFDVRIPSEIRQRIYLTMFDTIHYNVFTPEEARDCLVNANLINKYCNQLANNLYIIKNIISNLSTTLCGGSFYEEGIAQRLKTSATKKYIEINNQFFADNLKKNDIELLLQQGADPNYRRYLNNIKDQYDARTDYGLRHGWSRSPLIFYMLEETDDNIEIVKCLLDHGANIFIECALYVAIDRNLAQIIKLFLSYNPIFSPTDTWGYLSRAIAIGNPDVIGLVMNAPIPSCNFKFALLEAVNKQNPQLIQELFNHGATSDIVLEDVVTKTLTNPTMPRLCGTLPSTEILRLFINNGIEDETLRSRMIQQAKASMQRAKEVLTLLNGKTSTNSSDDEIPSL